MEKIKRLLHNMFIAVGFGTMVYVPMLIFDQGINDTMKSVLTWVFASLMYGLSFELLEIKTKIKYPIHILVCFIITIATRLMYSYIESGTINPIKTVVITTPIFIGVYIALFLFMKYIGNVKVKE